MVEAVVGGHASLPCNVSTPLEDDEATLILWYRLDFPNPIYTLDVRNSAIKNARHFPSDEMGGRAHFNISVHPPVLMLAGVTTGDEADYKCRVDLRRSRTLILHSRLRVIVPPSEPIIMDEHGQHLHDLVGPYDEGSTITFVCEVDGGDPSPNVTWWRGSVLFDDDFSIIKQRFVRNEMILEKLQRTELMVEYTCKASNTLLAKPRTASVQIDMNLLPTEARIMGMPLVLLAGDEHEFTCETRGSRPRALTTWWLDGQKITSGVSEIMREAGNVTFSTMTFTATPRDNGRRLLCKSANPALPKTTVEDERILRVHFAPMVNISLAGIHGQSGIREGSDVYLECSIWANPWIFEIAWQFEDRPLVANVTAGIVITNQTLLLQNVRRDHRGRYRCHASNIVGHSYSNHLRLLVQFAPICKSSEPRIYGISVTETVNVTCDVEADPQDVSYRWSLNTTLQTIVLSNWSRGHPYGVFSYSPQNKAGYGMLLCWGRNSIGSQREPCVIKIVPAGAPESPHDCLVTNQTLQSLTIECQAGYNGSLPQIFHMEIYNSIVEHMADNLTRLDKPRFHVTDLSPGTSYVLVIYASNIKGRSNSVALVASTLSTAERRTAQDDKMLLNPLTGVLIGVATLFIIIGIVIVIIVFKSHISRGDKRKEAALTETSIECDIPKKDLEDSPESGSNKGPDIIPLSIDPDVFFTGRVADEPMYGSKPDSPASEYVHEKYTDTVL